MKRAKIFIIFIVLCLLLAGCVSKKEAFSETGFYFDTAVSITLYGNDGKNKNLFNLFNDTCSYYDSELSATSDKGAVHELNSNNKVSVNKDIAALLSISNDFMHKYRGFDFMLGNLIDLWNISSSEPHVPTKEEIEKALCSGNNKIFSIYEDDGKYIAEKQPLFKVNLGGIAKGYVGDIIRKKLMDEGVENALLNMGSSTMILIGSKPDGSNFKIGLQKPFASEGETEYMLSLNNAAVSSSGIYERYFEENGIVYHHILDPFTGYPTDNKLLGVTVIVKYDYSVTNSIIPDTDLAGTLSDALSTALMVQGLDEGLKLVESMPNVEAIFINKEYNYTFSSGIVLNDKTFSLVD